MLDSLIIITIILWMLKNNYRIFTVKIINGHQHFFLQALWLYHLVCCYVFYTYILNYGGDALAYWNLKRIYSTGFNEWIGVWGTGTYFIELINYLPSKILRLNFFTGCIIYSLVSFSAIRQIYLMSHRLIGELNQKFYSNFLNLIFLLPNIHFWTSGVTKEALILFALAYWMLFLENPKERIFHLSIALLFSFMTRPVVGFIFIFLTILFLLLKNKPLKNFKWTSISVLILILGVFSYLVFQLSHITHLNWDGVLKYRTQQFEFLSSQSAFSEVPMQSYTLIYQVFTLFFRPFMDFKNGVWFLFASFENLISLIIITVGVFFYFKHKSKIPKILLLAGLSGLLLSMVHLLSFNNLGLMMRMKSPMMIIFHLIAFYVIVNKQINTPVGRYNSNS
jgi:hypothetical protein